MILVSSAVSMVKVACTQNKLYGMGKTHFSPWLSWKQRYVIPENLFISISPLREKCKVVKNFTSELSKEIVIYAYLYVFLISNRKICMNSAIIIPMWLRDWWTIYGFYLKISNGTKNSIAETIRKVKEAMLLISKIRESKSDPSQIFYNTPSILYLMKN